MEKVVVPKDYKSQLGIRETEIAIKFIKDYFEKTLAENLNLIRVSAPLFVKSSSGLNDTLNNVERPVSFDAKGLEGDVEIVQSLAKWKRMALKHYEFEAGEGLYTDMNAIRRDEDLDNIHSYYVDQWDWEKVLLKSDRTEQYLKNTVKSIYKAFKDTEDKVSAKYPYVEKCLPDDITFITSQELEDKYPTLTSKEREHAIAKECGAVFIMKIGDVLNSGEKHDGRSPDYDDWSLNGDLLFWYEPLQIGLELSSMGVRVDEEALTRQLELAGCSERKSLPFHSSLLNGELPYTIGGGIGQSRICMYFLRKAHIGEVQSTIWDNETITKCSENGINLL
ncbi:aspartate--ammonia ligase [Clostridium sp.]|uniref:aspartate--ammonia ligase n=1 Tax=Clostridium sp. TaxID=1506 RepID=UPI002FCB594F